MFGEVNDGAKYVVVGEYPDKVATEIGHVFVGPSGNELMHAVRVAGVNRKEVHWTNAVLCRPPADEMSKVLTSIRKENKRRTAAAKQAKAAAIAGT